MNKALPILSILISLAALAMSLVNITKSPQAGPTPEEINKMISAELDARDRARIAAIAPKAKAIYRDMLTPDKFNAGTFTSGLDPILIVPVPHQSCRFKFVGSVFHRLNVQALSDNEIELRLMRDAPVS